MLLRSLLPYTRKIVRKGALSPRTRVFAALQLFATRSYQRLFGQSVDISVSQQSVSNCVREVASLLTEHLAPVFIRFPTTAEHKQEIKNVFFQKYHFPGIIGSIDCTHVRILCPKEEEHNYSNRKGYHSLNVQIICDASLKILTINPRHGGATHDASAIKAEMEGQYQAGDRTSWLIGDSGYPLQTWLMTPILNASPNSPAARYTQAHFSARNCIEICNGLLKARYRCINRERLLRYDPQMAGYIVTDSDVLHIISLGDEDANNIELFEDDPFPVDARDFQIGFILNGEQRQRQRIVRQYFIN